MLKAVLDTNIIVTATIASQGNPARILDFWREDKFELIVTAAIIDEMWQVVFRPIILQQMQITEDEAFELLFKIQQNAIVVPPTLDLKVIKQDPTDDKYIIAAVQGNANYIVSGDKHLLALKEYQGIQIVTPREFVEILEAQEQSLP